MLRNEIQTASNIIWDIFNLMKYYEITIELISISGINVDVSIYNHLIKIFKKTKNSFIYNNSIISVLNIDTNINPTHEYLKRIENDINNFENIILTNIDSITYIKYGVITDMSNVYVENYFKDGLLHNVDSAAQINENGLEYYFLNGVELTFNEWNIKTRKSKILKLKQNISSTIS